MGLCNQHQVNAEHIVCRKTERVSILSTITISNGINRLTADLDGEDGCETLADILDLYRESLNIPEDATIAVNGETVDRDFDEVDLNDGDIVSATKTSGSKG